MQSVIVVDANGLNLSEDTYDTLADHYAVHNGSYHRYYPDDNWTYIAPDVKAEVNAALLAIGLEFPEVMYRPVGSPEGYFNYYILLHFSW